MDKRKTLKKQRHLFVKDMPIVKLKKGVKVSAHDPHEKLKDKDFIYNALLECLKAGDSQAFLDVIDSYYQAMNKSKTLDNLNLSRSTYYEAVKKKANPSLNTIMKLIKGISKAG
ncbi:MAG: DUF1492 domain-containing protein [Bdellovibrionales bacterium]|nr:DUF1492 domain-containing protein [Bdellovibrionales bacterium]